MQQISSRSSFKVMMRSVFTVGFLVFLTPGFSQTPDQQDEGVIEELERSGEDPQAVINSELTSIDETPLPIEQIRTFAEIFTRIKRSYVEPISDEKLLDYAVEGMLAGLDPHSVYLKDERFDQLNEGTQGQFGGLGMEVVMENGFVKVVTPIDDTPAAEAGVQPGDLIIRVDGSTVSGLTLQEATEKMRGAPGSSVIITILREAEPEPFDLTLERAVVRLSSVRRVSLSDQIGYLRVSQFQVSTAESFRKQLKMLRDIEGFSGLIIDLRNNPGGLLNSAISIADTFIKDGVIVSTKGRISANNQEFLATPSDLLEGKPIVVLINDGSASASEIVAGALQDHKRALILGTESFGKGSVQTVMTIGEHEAVKLTTARYYTPNGQSIQASGIVPDVFVTQREFKESEEGFRRIKENDLPGHLENDAEPINKKNTEEAAALLAADYQLNEAFNLLNGLVLFQ